MSKHQPLNQNLIWAFDIHQLAISRHSTTFKPITRRRLATQTIFRSSLNRYSDIPVQQQQFVMDIDSEMLMVFISFIGNVILIFLMIIYNYVIIKPVRSLPVYIVRRPKFCFIFMICCSLSAIIQCTTSVITIYPSWSAIWLDYCQVRRFILVHSQYLSYTRVVILLRYQLGPQTANPFTIKLPSFAKKITT